MNNDVEFEELLKRVSEESLRHYEKVELPRILSQQTAIQPGPSKYFGESDIVDEKIPRVISEYVLDEKKPSCKDEWEDMEWEDGFETAIQMHLEQAPDVPTIPNTDLDATLTTLERGEEARGFHRNAGHTWIFPTDFPERRYQFDICQTAILHDTLVCLPTGLGKTFIAAVVMYNMYRWYPQGCVIFLAPTRPLVNQQVTACRNVAGLPQEHTAELTGSINPATRKELWRSRRVFFMTPQTLANDLTSGIADAMRIRCVVLDEAHRARGGHAYCQLLTAIRSRNRCFRLLALSATPGANVAVVKEVLLALGVSKLEARAEDSPELAAFTHRRSIETIVLPLGGELQAFKSRIYSVVDEFSRTLRQRRLIQSSNLTKFGVLKASQAHRLRGPKDSVVESEFAVTLALCQAAELLCHHGLRAFHSNLAGLLADPTRNRVSSRLRNSVTLTQLMEDVGLKIGGDLVAQQEGAAPSYQCTHPKMQRLVQLVLLHFQECQLKGKSSRAIVFCQFREVVAEIQHALQELRPLVRPTHLIGQANSSAANRGQAQKQQRQVLRDFNGDVFNVMISTCVGEEGLDIAEVDLIICYEPHASPVRLVQRMGRTGRKRDGRVVMLITEGREQQKYQQGVAQGGAISRHLLQPENFREALATETHSMLPKGVVPKVMRMTMKPRDAVQVSSNQVQGTETSKPSSNRRQYGAEESKCSSNQDLRVMLCKQSANKESFYASHEAMLAVGSPVQCFRPREFLHGIPDNGRSKWEEPREGLDLGRWIEWQRLNQFAMMAKHSNLTLDLVDLLQFSGLKKRELDLQSSQRQVTQKQSLAEDEAVQMHKCENCEPLETNEKAPRKLQLCRVSKVEGTFNARSMLSAILKLVRRPPPPDGGLNALHFNTIPLDQWDDSNACRDSGLERPSIETKVLLDRARGFGEVDIQSKADQSKTCRPSVPCKVNKLEERNTSSPDLFAGDETLYSVEALLKQLASTHPGLSSKSPPGLSLKSPPRLSSKSPPRLSSKSPPRLSLKSPPGLSLKSPPRLSSKSPPRLSLKSPPRLSSKSPPGLSLKSPPGLSSKSPPGLSLKSPPGLFIKSPPGLSLKSPPGLFIKSPHRLSSKFPPGLSLKSPPGLSLKSPPGLSLKSPPGLFIKSPHRLSSKFPPGLSSKSPPGLSLKSPSVLSSKSPPGLSSKSPPGLSLKSPPGLSLKSPPGLSSRLVPKTDQDPFADLDLSDMLEGFNNPAVALGNQTRSPPGHQELDKVTHSTPKTDRQSNQLSWKPADKAPSSPLTLSSDSNSEFATPLRAGPSRQRGRFQQRKQIAGRRRKCRYVESEAESSGRDSSDGENSSGLDAYDSSFVDDVSLAKEGGASQYLGIQSTPSPLPHMCWPTTHAASYLEDSFVVKEADESFAVATQLSPLSLAEQKLARRRRRGKSPLLKHQKRKRRRRIKSPSS